ncbi:protein translocase subunit SecD [Paenibacillus sp. y28]|uniref:protein translocase subunit SecD n=1 Tax=Paenibacillus sp. y28 TaxID=3129110 RepID=UPI0030187920
MDGKRVTLFALIVVVILAAIGLTTPQLVKNVRLGLDLRGGFEILYVAEPIEAGKPVTRDSLRETAKSLEKRANSSGAEEPEVTPEGEDRIRARIAGVTDPDKVREILKKPAELTFRGPDGTKEMVGSDFKEGAAQVSFDPQTNTPVINIEVNDKEKLRDVSQRLLNQPLAIYLDEQQLSAPVVRAVLSDGKATISGNYSYAEANELAATINLGALPLKLTEKYTQSVGATLGLKSLEETVKAGIIGSILILLFMIVVYRVPGVIASITLITFSWMLLGVFNLMNVTLTLPGIAAFVLGIGMAVDANIITYERIKDELRSGKSITSSLKAGSKNSFRTILDANLTTILVCAVLYFYGTGSIQGFALTLLFSILISFITNVFLARLLLDLLIRGRIVTKPGYFGVKEAEIRAL